MFSINVYTHTRMEAEELIVSPSLHSRLNDHFQDWMDDEFNYNVNDALGYFFPHFELIEEEMRENEEEGISEYKELLELMDKVENLKVYLDI